MAKLIRYATTEDYAILGLEIALLLLIVFDVSACVCRECAPPRSGLPELRCINLQILEKVLFYRNFQSKLRETPWDMYDVRFCAILDLVLCECLKY